MSDPTPLPPFAQQAPPAPALVQAVPGQAIPVESPAYPFQTWPGGGRPPALTALGVASIVVACLSLLACLATAVFAVLFFATAKAADAAIAAHVPPPAPPAFLAPASVAPVPVEVARGGLADAQRRLAVGAIESIHPLAPPRAEQLDAIFARAGWRILGLADDAPFDADAVRAAVADHGEMFTGNRRVAPPEYFKTGAGRLELYDDRAVFYPADGSPPVRSSTSSASAPKPLTPEQVESVVKQVRDAPGGSKLNAAQLSGVSAALGFPNQRLAQASSGLNKEPRTVTTHPAGGATVRFTGGELYLSPTGQILSDPPDVSKNPVASANPAAFAVTLATAAANFGLAVLLVVAGLFVLRSTPTRPRGRRLHTTWAVIKIPLALAAAAGSYWMVTTVLKATSTLPAGLVFGSAPVDRAGRWAHAAYWPVVVSAPLGCVYPVVVLVAFRTRAIREFYRSKST